MISVFKDLRSYDTGRAGVKRNEKGRLEASGLHFGRSEVLRTSRSPRDQANDVAHLIAWRRRGVDRAVVDHLL